MTHLGAGFTPPSTTQSLEGMFEQIRRQVSAEVKSDINQEIVDRIIRVVASSFQNLTIEPRFTFSPTVQANSPAVEVEASKVYVTNEVDFTALVSAVEENSKLLRDTVTKLSRPIRRTVNRDSDGQIVSIIDEVM